MEEIVVSRVIDAPPERVWEVLTDIEQAPRTLSGVESVQVLTVGPYAEGTRWRETRTMFGRSSTEEMWVVLADPPHQTRVQAVSHGATFETTFVLTSPGAPAGSGDAASGTELTVRFGAQLDAPSRLHRLGMKLVGPMATRATRKALEQDLADIAAAAES